MDRGEIKMGLKEMLSSKKGEECGVVSFQRQVCTRRKSGSIMNGDQSE